MTIDDQLRDWTEFYTATAGVAGVLVGLLFVALAMNPSIMNESSPPGLRIWCTETFHALVVMLSFSLLFLIPGPTGWGIGVPITVIAVLGLRQLFTDFRQLRTDPDPRWSGRNAGVKQFGFMIAAYVSAIVVGVGLTINHFELIDWMVLPVFLLLTNAAINCLNILREVGNLPGSK